MYMCHHPLATMRTHARGLHVSGESARRATHRLARHGWVYTVKQSGGDRGGLVIPWMPAEVEARIISELAHVRSEIHLYGEWLMKCVLDLIIHDRNCRDNSRNQWLVHPDTGRRLELDRWYPDANIAFEFQGPQHFGPDGHFITTEAEYMARAERDQLKRDICKRHSVELIEITADDLDFTLIKNKVKAANGRHGRAPLFPVRMKSPLVRELTGMCQTYAANARRRRL